MTTQCKHPNCDAFARKLTGTEIRNLVGFNLPHKTCDAIFAGTVKGFCPHHAALALTAEERPAPSIIDVIRRKWYYAQDNFSESKAYALCSICEGSLSVDKHKNPIRKIEDTLLALRLPKQRIQTIVWLQGATGGLATCFDCSLSMHTDYEYDGNWNFVETELDRLCQADLA